MKDPIYLKMYTNCIISKGVNRSLILDIQRNSFQAIPDTMHDIIDEFKSKKTVEEVYRKYGLENKLIIDEYINYLIKNEFAFLAEKEEFDLFIDMDTNFEIPSYVTNCIIEISNEIFSSLSKIIADLEKLFCKNLQFICYEVLSLEVLINILNITKNNNIRSIEFVLKYSKCLIDFIPLMDKHNFKITCLTIHDSLNQDQKIARTTFDVNFIENEITNFSHCGIVNSKYFNVNQEKVLESLNYNSCLYKKISIDKNGYIKNCPSMTENFGNIKAINLEEALEKPNFKKYWNINKDQIEVCKDCEFRHICTDCRAYIEDPQNQYSKPLKCGYNPYTNEWSEWSTNPLKQKAIEFYGMQDLIKKDA